MAKLNQLRLMEIKSELRKRNVNNIGNKMDLLIVLENVLLNEGHSPQKYEFHLSNMNNNK